MSSSKSISPFITFSLILISSTIMVSPHLYAANAIDLKFLKKVVRIQDSIPTNNSIQPPSLLQVHCRSKQDDLGLWIMRENQEHEIRFQVNFWSSTLFWCNFNWGSKFKSFPVYDAQHDFGVKEIYSNWKVKVDGFYITVGEFPKDSDFKHYSYWDDHKE